MQNYIFLADMSLNYYKFPGLALISLLLIVNTSNSVEAQDISNSLPSLNSIENEAILLSKDNQNESETSSKEYTFKAPDNKSLSNAGQITVAQGYKVEVFGSAADLLLQVRDIEPKAFIKGDIIQVGIFSHRNNAENMVRKLDSEGLWSRIVTP